MNAYHTYTYPSERTSSVGLFTILVQRGNSLRNVFKVREYSLHFLINSNPPDDSEEKKIDFQGIKFATFQRIFEQDELWVSKEDTLNGVVDALHLQNIEKDVQLYELFTFHFIMFFFFLETAKIKVPADFLFRSVFSKGKYKVNNSILSPCILLLSDRK